MAAGLIRVETNIDTYDEKKGHRNFFPRVVLSRRHSLVCTFQALCSDVIFHHGSHRCWSSRNGKSPYSQWIQISVKQENGQHYDLAVLEKDMSC